MVVKLGEKIPEIEAKALVGGQEKKIRFSDYKGKWLVLMFYPADFTFVCPTELEEMAGLYGQFQNECAEILSLSTDTVFVHKAWQDHSPAIKKVKFPMLADPGGKICREFGTYIEGEGLSFRATFIIDPDGVLKSMEMNENAVGRSAKETLRKLQACKFVRETKGEVCPASWEPGKKTLKNTLDQVGKL